MTTPNKDKAALHNERIQHISAFLTWLFEDKELNIGHDTDFGWIPAAEISKEGLIAEYLEIDLEELRAEVDRELAAMKAQSEAAEVFESVTDPDSPHE